MLTVNLRVQLPSFFFDGEDAGIPVGGGSFSLLFAEWVELEAGAAYALYYPIDGRIAVVDARAGISPRLLDHRDSRMRGWVLRLPVHVGYCWMDLQPNHEKTNPEQKHFLTLNFGLEATRWFGGIGLDMRVLGQTYVGLAKNKSDGRSIPFDQDFRRLGGGINFSIGLSF